MELEKLCDINLYQGDCMDLMKQYPDKYFDLAIVDPPYGIERFQKGSLRFDKKGKYANGIKWDKIPSDLYFIELFRVSKNQVIWGANNFILPPTEHFCIWSKHQTVDNFSSAEYAWVSMGLKIPAKVFDYSIHQHNQNKISDHPTEKPVKLYKWLLQKYAKEGDKILDTHFGSLSIGIACHDLHFELTASELDKEYYELGKNRLMWHQKQLNLF